jgi:hypothetical protein
VSAGCVQEFKEKDKSKQKKYINSKDNATLEVLKLLNCFKNRQLQQSHSTPLVAK